MIIENSLKVGKMFVADIVIMFVVFIGVSYILFGKKKDV